MIYRGLGGPKESYSRLTQTGVSFAGGYLAGILCAIVSHPADVMVSKLNAERKGMFYQCFLFSPFSRGHFTDDENSWRGRNDRRVPDLQQDWLCRIVERFACSYCHAGYFDWIPVVDVRIPLLAGM